MLKVAVEKSRKARVDDRALQRFLLPPSLLLFNNFWYAIGTLILHFADVVKITIARSQCGNLKSPFYNASYLGPYTKTQQKIYIAITWVHPLLRFGVYW